MPGDYASLTKFIVESIVRPGLSIVPLVTTKSAIASITRRFDDLGWAVELTSSPGARPLRHKMTSPDGEDVLDMVDAKVYRHPASTDQICKRKHLTKRMLDLAGLPAPAGGDFSVDEKDVAAAFFEKMPKPVVVKPTGAGASKGVTVGVDSLSGFDAAWGYAVNGGGASSRVLIEEFVRGVELRAFVIGDEVVSVVARVQPHVIGTGYSTLPNLVDNLAESRKVNYRARKMPVVVDWDFVGSQGFGGAEAPPKGEVVFLNPFSLPSVGAFIVDATEAVAPKVKEIARRATEAIPFLEIAGVDLMVEDLLDERTAYVLEVNTAATLEMHRYPTHGKSRAVDVDIVDFFDGKYRSRLGA